MDVIITTQIHFVYYSDLNLINLLETHVDHIILVQMYGTSIMLVLV
jgi:hypothetical protein